MPIVFDVQGKDVYVRVYGDPTSAERRKAGRKFVRLAGRGYWFPQNRLIRRGKKCFRRQRRLNVERIFETGEFFGLEILPGPQLTIIGPEHFALYLPDYETLGWWRSEFVVMVLDGRPTEVPIGIDGRVRAFLVANQVRCLTGWSQSYLEKYASQCPGLLKEPGKFGVPWAVDTIEFLRHFGDPKYPFMPRRMRLHPLGRRAV